MERLAYTGSVRDLAREQAVVLQSTRERIVNDVSRALKILRQAAHDARKVTEREAAPAAVKRKPKSAPPKAKRAQRKAKRKVTRTTRRRRTTAR
jgi:Sec-independent protein translocase protein TatA